jgi:hypothetical protein
MVRLSLPLFFAALLLGASGGAGARAQEGGVTPPAAAASPRRMKDTAVAEARDGLLKATGEYKESLKELRALREREAEKISTRVQRLRRLQAEGVVSLREVEAFESEAARARAGVKETTLRLEAADYFLAEALAEAEAGEEKAGRKATPRASHAFKTALIRFNGTGGWALPDVSRVEGFFSARFGRPLPVTAFGQSELHTRWGFDHRNSVDVGLHPDSAEGRALVAYLRGAGLPFLAFRSAMPGSATGPHIHIGRPSHRVRPR